MRAVIFDRHEGECPRGSEWHDCHNGGHYFGCCDVNACQGGGIKEHVLEVRVNLLDDKGDNNNKNDEDEKDDEDSEDDDEKSPRATTVASLGPPLTAPIELSTRTLTMTDDETTDETTAETTDDTTIITTTQEASATSDLDDMDDLVTPTDLVSESPVSTSDIGAPSPKTDEEDGSGSGSISVAAKGGIFGAIGAVMLIVIAAFFLCGKRGRKLRKSLGSGLLGSNQDPYGSKNGLGPYDPPPPTKEKPMEYGDVFVPFGGRYEEPHSRYTRASAFTSSTMKNHPISSMSRKAVDLNPPPPAAAAATAPPGSRLGMVSPDYTRNDTSINDASRTDMSTPQLHGSPKCAVAAEIFTPGLPRIIEISSNRHNIQKYKAYRPNMQQHPTCNSSTAASSTNLRGDLRATAQERSQNKYVNS